VHAVAAYRRCAPDLDAAGRGLLEAALREPRAHVWLFSSSEAIDNLAALAGVHADWSQGRAVATHERIAERARRLGLARVEEARPSLGAVSACIQSMAP
jgi:uroporphyrinogen-III synthase